MIESLLVASRGEIARRIIRTAKRLGVRTVAVYSEPDAQLPFVVEADQAVLIGPANPAQSYRDAQAILAAAKSTGVQAVHPGYGFLSESADFARAIEANGLVWVGPPADAIAAMGDKINARNLMAEAGLPIAPGWSAAPTSSLDSNDSSLDSNEVAAAAAELGYPVMLKAAAGGGGMGMAVVTEEARLRGEYERVCAFAKRMFGTGSVLLERYFPQVRHVEVQILGLADGRVLPLGERECSVQRRNQKLLEESPSPAVSPQLRQRLLAAAVRAGETVGYRGAGTVEFLLDATTREFFFLEMNTRLQVEHPVTEVVYGVDLVEEQLRVASGEPPAILAAPAPYGHAIELRINTEDPKRFLPGPGLITTWIEPVNAGVRVDSGYRVGNLVTPFYDSLLAKLIVSGPDRATAIERARLAVSEFKVEGPKCNLPFFAELLAHPDFVSGDYDTGIVSRMR